MAISPMLEILSAGAVSDTTLGLSRVNWALPFSMELDTDNTHSYATVGYFSRGAVSVGVASERTLTDWLTLVGTAVYSRTTRSTAATDLAGLSPSRTDAALGVYLKVSPTTTLSASAGRTISRMDQNGGRLIASAGLSVSLGRRATPRQ